MDLLRLFGLTEIKGEHIPLAFLHSVVDPEKEGWQAMYEKNNVFLHGLAALRIRGNRPCI